jgi:hypothetical protein
MVAQRLAVVGGPLGALVGKWRRLIIASTIEGLTGQSNQPIVGCMERSKVL